MAPFTLKFPPKYILASTVISLGGLLFGLETGSIGSLTTMPQFHTSFGVLTSSVHGLLISSILLPAAFSSLFGGHLANSLGRTKAIALGGVIFGIGASLEASSFKLGMLITGRAIKGLGEGVFLSTVVVYITEISPPRSRGTLASIPQLGISIGVCLGYFTCYGSVRLPGSISWRLPFALQACIAYSFVALTLAFCPESPRWLTSLGQHSQALSAWENLAVAAAEREKIEESTSISPPVRLSDILSLFRRSVWRQTALGVFLMGMQQASGIDGVLYYAPLLFASAGLSSSAAAFLASGISALLMLLITIPAFLLMDRINRRTSSIAGGCCIAGCMFLIGSLYATSSVHSTAGKYIVIIAIYVFALAFSATWAVGFRVYVSEIQSRRTRAGASSLALSANWLVNFLIALTTPMFLARSTYGVYFFFGGCTLVTVVVCAFAMPETRGRSLEEIEEVFRDGSKGLRGSGRRGRGNEEGVELGVLVLDDDPEVRTGEEGWGNERKQMSGGIAVAVASGSSSSP